MLDETKIRPIGEWVLMRPEPIEQKTASGLLYVPQNSKRKTFIGRVLAVGPGKKLDNGRRHEPDVRAGDRVLYLEHNIAQGVHDMKDGEQVQLIPGSEIIAVVEE